MKKRILHVVNSEFVLNYYFGDQILFFQQNGYEVFIACPDGPIYKKFITNYNLKYLQVNITRKFSIFQDFIAIYNIYSVLKEYKIGIVFGHTPKGALISMMSSYLSSIKCRVYVRHGLMYETSTGLKRLLFISIERFTSLLSTHIICVSNSVFNISVKKKLSPEHKMIIIGKGTYNGVDSKVLFNPNLINDKIYLEDKHDLYEKQVIGFVGRIVKDKGIEELLEAWKILLKTKKDIILLIIGPFEHRDSISLDLINYIRNEPTIIHVNYTTLVQCFYKLMDIFILPSRREGFPTVNLEASSMMVPVITTKSTGCIDSIIDKYTGIFCELSSDSIQKAIIYYLENPQKRIEHGKNGRKFVKQNFDQSIVWNELLKFINNIPHETH